MMNGGNKFKLWVEIWNEPFFKCKYLQNEGGKKIVAHQITEH